MNKSKYKDKPNQSKDKSKTNYKNKGGNKNGNRNNTDSGRDNISDRVNNPGYYFSDETLKNQVTNIAFTQFTGTDEILTLADASTTTVRMPSVMRFALNPSAGVNDTENGPLGSAINLQSLGLYTFLSANNAKTSDYAPQDITTMLLAMGSIIELSSYITRCFGMPYLYNNRNRVFPKRIVNLSGVDYDDLMSNFANYRIRFNSLMAQAGNIPVPANIKYFDKCRDIYSGIYLDSPDNPMAQVYLFVPYTVWKMDEESYSEGTILIDCDVVTEAEPKALSHYLDTLESMLSAVLKSTTLQKVYADILRVSQKEGMPLYTFTGVPDGYSVIPSYVPEISLWINNSTIMGAPTRAASGYELPTGSTSGNVVLPDVNSSKVIYKPEFTNFFPMLNTVDPILNFPIANPSPDLIVEATRFVCGKVYETKVLTSGVRATTRVALPDHYVVNVLVGYADRYEMITSNAMTVSIPNARLITALANFMWSPNIMSYTVDGNEILGYNTNLQYYTYLPFDYIRSLQDATYLGLFEIR